MKAVGEGWVFAWRGLVVGWGDIFSGVVGWGGWLDGGRL